MKRILYFLVLFIPMHSMGQVSLIKENETCDGRNDGSIEVVVTGIDGPFNYRWADAFTGKVFGGNAKKVTGLKPGDYSVTVSLKSGGCMDSKSAKIWPGKSVNVDISSRMLDYSPRPLPCGKRPTLYFELTALPSGGTPPYYCSWAKGGDMEGGCIKNASGEDIEAVVVIYDDKGCIASDVWSIKAATKVCPMDPNDIAGPDGYGAERWVSVHDEMTYATRFENDPIFATSNASVVFITVPIDDDVDPLSFRLSSLGFGNKVIEVPDNVSFFQQRLDYAEDLGFLLDVTAGLDLPNQRFFWLLETIDPLTGQPPSDPLAGFLPVNDTLTGSGEGFVNFTCRPKQTTPTGEYVEHQASIIFDSNDPLLTNTWSNKIDALPPTTVPAPLVDTFYTNLIPFEWIVEDDPGGCGVQYTEVFLAADTSALQASGFLFQNGMGDIPLQWGTTYYYNVISTDNVNNTEVSTTDSFYIVPQRTIEFITPDQDNYCIGDTLLVDIELVTIPTVDLYISIDSGMTYTLLETNVNQWPFAIFLDSAFLYPYMFIKAVSETDNIEQISDPFALNFLPVITAVGDPAEGCDSEILFVEADGTNEFLWWPDSIIGNSIGRFSNVYADVSQFAYVRGTDVFGCAAIDSVWLTVYPSSRDTLTQPLCEGDSIWIYDQWISEEGFYPVTFVDIHDCDSVIVTEVFFESPCIWTGGIYVYVDEDATGDNNGTSWANAFNELRDAIYVAGRYENVQEIWVAEGIYSPHPTNRDTSFILHDSIKIYGGFLGFETSLAQRTTNAELVQLSGDINITDTLWDNSYHTVILSTDCKECVLDRVTITYGHADNVMNENHIGAGVLNEGKGHFKNVVFERNYATDLGAALHSSGSAANLVIEDCIFRLNISNLGRDIVNLAGAQVEFKGANSIH